MIKIIRVTFVYLLFISSVHAYVHEVPRLLDQWEVVDTLHCGDITIKDLRTMYNPAEKNISTFDLYGQTIMSVSFTISGSLSRFIIYLDGEAWMMPPGINDSFFLNKVNILLKIFNVSNPTSTVECVGSYIDSKKA